MPTLPKFKIPGARPAVNGSGGSQDQTSGGSVALGAAAIARFRTKESVFADNTFRSLVFACALALLAVVGLIVFELITQSHLCMKTFGFKFLQRSIWDPVAEDFGALPFIYGTLVSSFIALILAVPLS